ncbi:MAG TPA: DUF5677 domain-containing protein [Rhizomicrobium sp.]
MGGFPTIERTDIDSGRLAEFIRESDFTSLAVDLLREVASYACVAACTLGAEPTWDRDQAVVGGNMVRLYKLLDALLDQTCKKRRETSTIFVRLAFETAINIRYLIANFSSELVKAYIRFSLRHERGLRNLILSNIDSRGGTIEPIEQRMLSSLDRTARVAGISLDSIDPNDRTPHWGGKSIRQKAISLGLEGPYDSAFGGMSHNVHGSWQDLYDYHLKVDGEGRFTPNLDWRMPRPQILTAMGLIAVGTAHDFLGFIGGTSALDQLAHKLTDLEDRILMLDEAHENFLNKIQGS